MENKTTAPTERLVIENERQFCLIRFSPCGKLLAAGKTMLSLGGDHFVTLPLLRAHHRQFGKLAMIHFDAHTDTYEEEDAVYNHGSMFYHAPREGIIDPAAVRLLPRDLAERLNCLNNFPRLWAIGHAAILVCSSCALSSRVAKYRRTSVISSLMLEHR